MSTCGRKKELVARVFIALENGVQPEKTASEVESEIKNLYQRKLKIDDIHFGSISDRNRLGE